MAGWFERGRGMALDVLVGEICDVFKTTPYFHMGGDEVRYWSSWETPHR